MQSLSKLKEFPTYLTPPPPHSFGPLFPVTACTLLITGAVGTGLPVVYSLDPFISSLTKGVYNPKTFILHAALLLQGFSH